MIYVTGDTHAGLDMDKLAAVNLEKRGITLTEKDYMIITGDFGFPFLESETMFYEQNGGAYRFWMRWFRDQPYTFLWVDGNHDNHDFWSRQEVTKKFGGLVQVHPHADNIIHLMRGEVYTIEEKKFFTFGGAVSIDKEMRVPNLTWWEKEQATQNEINYARKKLRENNNCVDYILTHTMPISIIFKEGYIPIEDRGAEYFDEVMHTVEYKKWFCGHFHVDKFFEGPNIQITHNQIYKI